MNKRRTNLKHHGLFPSEDGIEESRVFTKQFFEENTIKHFNVDFNKISLISLLQFEKTKEFLTKAEKLLGEREFRDSIKYSAFAFARLLEEYKSNKKSLFSFSRNSSYSFSSSFTTDLELSRNLGEIMKGFDENILSIEKIVHLMALGINIRKFTKFNIITPEYFKDSGGEFQTIQESQKEMCDQNNAGYCINFVIESGISLQEFDFEIEEFKKN